MDEITLHIWGMQFSVLALLVTAATLAGAAGYYIGRRRSAADSARQPSSPPESYGAFLQGIHYILANETDQAIEAFTRAVQVNSDTIETYVALGNLFRVKGEIDRAIRIRQTILLRQNVDPETKLQALFDLALDYKQGGFLQRAISTFEEVIRRAPQRLDAYTELESLYEAGGDWQRAYELQQEICKRGQRSTRNVLAHLQTEVAKNEMQMGRLDAARSHLKKALSLDPHCVDARLQLGELHWLRKKKRKALSIWGELVRNDRRWAHLVFNRLEGKNGEPGDEARLLDFFTTLATERLDAPAQLALGRCFLRRGRKEQALAALKRALELDPGLRDARRLLGETVLAEGDSEAALNEYRALLEQLDSGEKRYLCHLCGFETDQVLWKCPRCQKWDSIEPRRKDGGRPPR